MAYLLARNIRYEEDLVDQLFNSSEKRLARMLLLLAHFGKEGKPEVVIPKMSQEISGIRLRGNAWVIVAVLNGLARPFLDFRWFCFPFGLSNIFAQP
jgi:hypothetical protein